MEILVFLSKWLHVLSMAGVVGGLFFGLFVLGALRPQSEGEEDEKLKLAWKRFGISMGLLWIVVLITGFYNLSVVTPEVNATYQTTVGIKIGLALLMFFITLAVAHPVGPLKKFFRERNTWLAILLIAGIIIVGISADLNLSRINGSGLKKPPAASVPTAIPPAP
ncbi:MAG TPA: hypothetical protein VKV18_12850 [Chthonomonas sp.]|jgi:putative copper export protein|uniref:hypothetical protein n=1 Tax=Chthonomonas sp. TaxID=2282153 RepID=UPI002B4B7812|nr:hypothetical protein [Chthonomonas sp.]HLH81318.1 hypothetical protein [Chthonomonas sp.]HLI49559.1 hypothetical protein [Chthonomonas sp.]